MYKEIKGALLSAIVSISLTVVFTFLMTFIWGNQGEIIYSSVLSNDKYVNNITIKNMQKNEYLNKFNILIDGEIEIKDDMIFVNGIDKKIEKNNIEIEKVKPKEVISISFETDNIIDEEGLFLIKSQQRIGIENFNDKKNLNIYWFILLGFYFVVNFVFYLLGDVKTNKRYDEYKKALEKAEKSNESCENTIKELIKKESVNKIIFVKEMNDMEKELKFYQQIILKCINKEMTKDELESLISKSLKTFKKKKIKHLSYNDLYHLVGELSETVDTNNRK